MSSILIEGKVRRRVLLEVVLELRLKGWEISKIRPGEDCSERTALLKVTFLPSFSKRNPLFWECIWLSELDRLCISNRYADTWLRIKGTQSQTRQSEFFPVASLLKHYFLLQNRWMHWRINSHGVLKTETLNKLPASYTRLHPQALGIHTWFSFSIVLT